MVVWASEKVRVGVYWKWGGGRLIHTLDMGPYRLLPPNLLIATLLEGHGALVGSASISLAHLEIRCASSNQMGLIALAQDGACSRVMCHPAPPGPLR